MYFKPYIDEAGLHLNTYEDIRDHLITEARRIFGEDIYLENDAADYQYISLVALVCYDLQNSLALAYDSRSPATAIGRGLESLVLLNGVSKKTASYSNCQVMLTGTPGYSIINGAATDDNGNTWLLASPTVLPSSGLLQATVTCSKIGAIKAGVGEINKIATPQRGWDSIINQVPAVAGQPVETDAELRRRQKISVAIPSQTILEGTIAGIASISGVTRYKVYENDTNISTVDPVYNPYGLPAHSITAIVEGGQDIEVAQQIRLHKTPGCYTNGDVDVTITNSLGLLDRIRFYRPVYVPITVEITIRPYGGFTQDYLALIRESIAMYLNNLDIGDDLAASIVGNAALAVNTTFINPQFSVVSGGVLMSRGDDPLSPEDIEIDYNEVVTGDVANITVHVEGA